MLDFCKEYVLIRSPEIVGLFSMSGGILFTSFFVVSDFRILLGIIMLFRRILSFEITLGIYSVSENMVLRDVF